MLAGKIDEGREENKQGFYKFAKIEHELDGIKAKIGAEELNLQGHRIDPDTVVRLLKERDHSHQANEKTKEAGS